MELSLASFLSTFFLLLFTLSANISSLHRYNKKSQKKSCIMRWSNKMKETKNRQWNVNLKEKKLRKWIKVRKKLIRMINANSLPLRNKLRPKLKNKNVLPLKRWRSLKILLSNVSVKGRFIQGREKFLKYVLCQWCCY